MLKNLVDGTSQTPNNQALNPCWNISLVKMLRKSTRYSNDGDKALLYPLNLTKTTI